MADTDVEARLTRVEEKLERMLGLLEGSSSGSNGASTNGSNGHTRYSGLVVSTFLTLFVIPVIYSLIDRLKARLTGSELVAEAPSSVALGELAGTGES